MNCPTHIRQAAIRALQVAGTEGEILTALARLGGCDTPTHDDLVAVWNSVPQEVLAEVHDRLERIQGKPFGDALTAIPLVTDIHAKWRIARARGSDARHPFAPLVEAWRVRTRRVEPFRPKNRASLPRLDRTTVVEARRCAEPRRAGQVELLLDPGTDVIDSCPSWLLEMYTRAMLKRRITKGMPYSFSLVLGVLVHTPVANRTGVEIILDPMGIDEIVGWLHPGPKRWTNRTRDWARLDAAFEEMPSYRITTGGYRWWVALGEGLPETYHPDAQVIFRSRVPVSAAKGMRIDWPILLKFRSHATMTRAYLSVMALLDRSARQGHPITRLVRKNGCLVDNPAGRFAPLLPRGHEARFIGMADTKKARFDARRALNDLHKKTSLRLLRSDVASASTVLTCGAAGQQTRFIK